MDGEEDEDEEGYGDQEMEGDLEGAMGGLGSYNLDP